jgi:hypothetical protein
VEQRTGDVDLGGIDVGLERVGLHNIPLRVLSQQGVELVVVLNVQNVRTLSGRSPFNA